MSKARLPQTAALRILKAAGVEFGVHPYEYREGGAAGLEAAEALGVEPACMYKAVMFEVDKLAVLALVPSAERVALGKLTRAAGARRKLAPTSPARAEALSGYRVGGISAIGLRREMPVFLHEAARGLGQIYVNGGHRGLIVQLRPDDLVRVTGAQLADIIEE